MPRLIPLLSTLDEISPKPEANQSIGGKGQRLVRFQLLAVNKSE